MKEPEHFGETLPDGVQLTLSELRDMACRQQAQIDSQHQLLAAKEQRLRYLKEQEARQQRVQAESERLRRLRDRVDAQELKLRKLRALRGQVDHQKQNNVSLTSDLDSIRALFNEKEKELSLAVAKVEELTRQLEELGRGRSSGSRDQTPPASALELDKLRRELMYRNKLNEQQNFRLNQQREALTARQEEMSAIDKRISELQERLHRKRVLNQQLVNQISAASHKAVYHQLVRLTSSEQNNQTYVRKTQQNNGPSTNGLSRGNVVAVEPYNHVPLPSGHQIKTIQQNTQENSAYPSVYQQNHHIKKDNDQLESKQESQDITNKISNLYPTKQEDGDILKEFTVSKSDPKYQTLPYNTKFTVNFMPNRCSNRVNENNNNNVNTNNENKEEIAHHVSTTWAHVNGNVQSHMTVHSAPLSVINKNIATPLNQNDLLNRKVSEQSKEQISTAPPIPDGRTAYQNNNKYPSTENSVFSTNSSTGPITTTYQKPINSIAPTTVQHSGKLSNVYQTSSTKVQPVEPQTISPGHKPSTIQQNQWSSPQSLALSPPQSTSTPSSGTPEISEKSPKPALPPKPTIKPPPRQTQSGGEPDHPPPLPLTEPPDDSKVPPKPLQSSQSKLGFVGYGQNKPQLGQSSAEQQPIPPPQIENMPIIKAKPLTIKKQPFSEQPKLRNISSYSKLNGISLSNRRVEIPPAFNFHELNSTEKPQENSSQEAKGTDETDRAAPEEPENKEFVPSKEEQKTSSEVIRRCKKGNLKQTGKANLSRRVSFDPLALLLDASLEGELELVKKTATQVPNPSAANDEGITALHNAICAGHLEIVKFLVEFGCDVNAQDSDGWTPLHCAASCNNVAMVRFLVEHGACIFATTLSDHETAAEKCEEDEEGFDGCSEYLYSVQEKLGILSGGVVYAVFDYTAQQPDELSFKAGQQLTVLRKGDENEREWWWSRLGDKEGYVPRNLLGLYPRVSKSEE